MDNHLFNVSPKKYQHTWQVELFVTYHTHTHIYYTPISIYILAIHHCYINRCSKYHYLLIWRMCVSPSKFLIQIYCTMYNNYSCYEKGLRCNDLFLVLWTTYSIIKLGHRNSWIPAGFAVSFRTNIKIFLWMKIF